MSWAGCACLLVYLSVQASTSADGTLKIWLLEKKECLKTISCLSKFSDATFNHPLGRMAWEAHCGLALAVPCGRDGIKLFSYETWTEKATLLCSGEPKVTCTGLERLPNVQSMHGLTYSFFSDQLVSWDKQLVQIHCMQSTVRTVHMCPVLPPFCVCRYSV